MTSLDCNVISDCAICLSLMNNKSWTILSKHICKSFAKIDCIKYEKSIKGPHHVFLGPCITHVGWCSFCNFSATVLHSWWLSSARPSSDSCQQIFAIGLAKQDCTTLLQGGEMQTLPKTFRNFTFSSKSTKPLLFYSISTKDDLPRILIFVRQIPYKVQEIAIFLLVSPNLKCFGQSCTFFVILNFCNLCFLACFFSTVNSSSGLSIFSI